MDLGEIITEHSGYTQHVDTHVDALKLNFEKTKFLLTQDVSDDNFNEAFQNFYEIVKIIPLLKNTITIPQIVRARRNENGKMFTEKSDLSYNLKRNDLINLGRFNRKYEPLFYGSLPVENSKLDYVLACALECCKELADQNNLLLLQDFSISGWIVEKQFDVVTLCFDQKHLVYNPSLKDAVDGYLKAITDNFSVRSAEFIKTFLTFYSELSGQPAIGDRTYYVLTALFVAIRYYYKTIEKSRIFGLIYPSAMTESVGLNIVLTRHAVDNFLRLDKVVMYRYALELHTKTYFAQPCSGMVKVKGDTFVMPGFIPQPEQL
jgi:hypothetical protein